MPKYGTKRQRCKLVFDLYLQSDLLKGQGWNFNISDSSNNGYGGDAGHTSNSAEVHNYCDDVLVYSNVLDGHETYPKEFPGLLIDRKYDIMSTHMTITVGDEFLNINNNRSVSCSYQSPYLFTLRGQKPTYGSVNYDIFFSMNRVVWPYSYTSRTGVGLCKAVIKAVDCEIQYGTPTITPIKH